ncbi:hypothetical protein [Desulfofalx alkaliphila]|uniref:hypothetical protein n=1 Tax=Desulfofalx alkaliphila TaxID=105483 RepID=UPI0004E1531F|nr:hypothetical protein [Desulfofalx alkaliphila]
MKETWFTNLTTEEAIAYVEASPFGKDWEGNHLDLRPLSWCTSTGLLTFSDGRYQATVRFQENGTLRYIGDTNPLNMVEAALAAQKASLS